MNLIGNAVLAVLRNPGQWAALGADADRAPAIVEETLRYDPPVQLAGRIALADMVIGGVEVPAGDVMMLLLAGANRDPPNTTGPMCSIRIGRTCGTWGSAAGRITAWARRWPGWRPAWRWRRSPRVSRTHGWTANRSTRPTSRCADCRS